MSSNRIKSGRGYVYFSDLRGLFLTAQIWTGLRIF